MRLGVTAPPLLGVSQSEAVPKVSSEDNMDTKTY